MHLLRVAHDLRYELIEIGTLVRVWDHRGGEEENESVSASHNKALQRKINP